MMHISQILMIADKAAEDSRCNKMYTQAPDDFCLVFAELIIKECLKQIRKATPTVQENIWEEGAKWAFEESVIAIQDHFGVS